MELIRNRHLSSICMKCRYVGGKYIHFMTLNSCRPSRVRATLLRLARQHPLSSFIDVPSVDLVARPGRCLCTVHRFNQFSKSFSNLKFLEIC
jgi:hypothetical protein